jgi:putative flavoprotein involved in K+ transport
MPFPKGPTAYPHKDEVADFVEGYALHCDLPVRLRTRVDALEADPAGGYRVTLGAEVITCDNVVVATGTFGRTPAVPGFAADLHPSIRQLHSSEYRRPTQLQPGRVLVVGASHSGTDIAYEVALTHETVLAGRDCGQIPVRLGTPAARVFFPVFVFVGKHLITRRTPMGRKAMDEIRHHGGPMLRVKRQDLADRKVERRTARVVGVTGGFPVLDDGTVVDATNVVWATGFRHAFDWIRLPVLGEDGWPREYRGEATDAPGMFFAGLGMQYSFTSMLIGGAGRDAEYVARKIARRAHSATPVAV